MSTTWLWNGDTKDYPYAKRAFALAPLAALIIPGAWIVFALAAGTLAHRGPANTFALALNLLLILCAVALFSYAVTLTYGAVLYLALTRSKVAGFAILLILGFAPGGIFFANIPPGAKDMIDQRWIVGFMTLEGVLVAISFWLIARGVFRLSFLENGPDRRGLAPQKL